jgi:hypothetical protein
MHGFQGKSESTTLTCCRSLLQATLGTVRQLGTPGGVLCRSGATVEGGIFYLIVGRGPVTRGQPRLLASRGVTLAREPRGDVFFPAASDDVQAFVCHVAVAMQYRIVFPSSSLGNPKCISMPFR